MSEPTSSLLPSPPSSPLHDKVPDEESTSLRPTRGQKFHPGKRATCRFCGLVFESRNKLHIHLKLCRPAPLTTTTGQKREAPAPPERSAHCAAERSHGAAEDASIRGNDSKRRRFTHNGLGGAVDAIEHDGTTYYDPDHARAAHVAVAAAATRADYSPHKVWRRSV